MSGLSRSSTQGLYQGVHRCSWIDRIKLEINAAKTVLVIFSKGKVSLPALSLRVGSQVIHPSSSTRLLGVVIDQHLRWNEHIQEREISFKRTLHSVRRFLGRTWGLSKDRLKTLYTAIVEPVFLYGCSVWATDVRTKRGRKKLRSIQRGYNLIMLRSFRTADAGSLSILSGTLPIDYRVREITLRRDYIGGYPSFSPSVRNLILEDLEALNLRMEGGGGSCFVRLQAR